MTRILAPHWYFERLCVEDLSRKTYMMPGFHSVERAAKRWVPRWRTLLIGGLMVCSILLNPIRTWSGDGQAAPTRSPGASISSPPDTTNYSRKAVPEDIAPGGKPAVGPNVVAMPAGPAPTPQA